MIWWLRVRMAAAVGAGLVLCMVLGPAGDSVKLPVPVLTGERTFPLPLAFLLPLVPVCLVLQGHSRADTGLEQAAVRAVRHWDVAFMALCAGAALLAGAVEKTGAGRPLGLAMARDFAGYLGIALVVRAFASVRAAAAAVAVFPFLCASFGVRAGRPAVWAWPLHDTASVSASAQAGCLFTAGLAVTAWREPRTRGHGVRGD
ncbi:hypothetical protein RKE29_15920 [Streptomyces sp. B1866]|uniref:hypothetical protein n=1 Tax=Streptomyces sp. B1866 TaxID=3075431 RepID=UPI0028917F2C|nr:hypothetical protein [Streptomyces sp. B1866]MDT3398110.1 hypothetical protein [Streptomyces sp. B1866]